MSITMWESLARRAVKRAADAFEGIGTLAEWEAVRSRIRGEFLQSLGIDLLDGRCAPGIVERGEFCGDGFVARKIGFQILPNCWTSATIYYPEPRPSAAMPGVLYVCGHGRVGTHHYQAQPILWARRGYVCLIVDTIAQSDNTGSHAMHLTGRQDLWLSLGYNPGGGEALNSLRALDVLADDPAVDENRLGVTGISGGGALSFYVAVIDERIKAVATLCGVSPPIDAIGNRRLHNHCDCMYPNFMHGRDLSEFAALIAPRAALFCYGDDDSLFCARETAAMVERTSRIYDLYGEGEKCRLLTYACGHETHPVFNEETQKWFDAHVAGAQHPVLEKVVSAIPERTTAIFNGKPPQPNFLHLLPELVRQRGGLPLPDDAEHLTKLRQQVVAQLRLAGTAAANEQFTEVDCWHSKGTCRRRLQANVEGVDIWLETIRDDSSKPKLVLSIAQAEEWSRHAYARGVSSFDGAAVSCATLEHRLAGLNFVQHQPAVFPLGARLVGAHSILSRGLAILGDTPVSIIINDIRPAVEYLLNCSDFQGYEIYLFGCAEGAVAALYYALMDERISGLVLEDLPGTHADGAALIGVLNTLDIPQAVGLMAPRKVALIENGHANWTWATRTYERLDCAKNLAMVADRRSGFSAVL